MLLTLMSVCWLFSWLVWLVSPSICQARFPESTLFFICSDIWFSDVKVYNPHSLTLTHPMSVQYMQFGYALPNIFSLGIQGLVRILRWELAAILVQWLLVWSVSKCPGQGVLFLFYINVHSSNCWLLSILEFSSKW